MALPFALASNNSSLLVAEARRLLMAVVFFRSAARLRGATASLSSYRKRSLLNVID
jgi:hypothetical protein